MTETKEMRVLRAIAAALTMDPALSYQKLADIVGVSRRTLYRIAPSREALLEKLREFAIEANSAALAKLTNPNQPFISLLRGLTVDFLADAQLYSFWAADTWGKAAGPQLQSSSDVELHHYRMTMKAFFERGQRDGSLRGDLSATWLVHAYDGLLSAAAGTLNTGTLAPADLPDLIVNTLLHGASSS
ncbi:TetR/AcrR family transcriptional regulator [Pseudomonas sp. R5(2019)]|uniref:TetR/AcrR family transcriptional regulator n=1 Tax=Pseudomonas sp. R5(2019) TaxID=2697566 RepID=UPI00141360E4|nr:TetR/AcrR family transcriptional regulator [Pseudomonas sp. R5(2019)]NBA98143.1 hypothetical protein [Pseudomonas sp. R5(2019)]